MTNPRWDWDDVVLRTKLSIGTVLEGEDCGYIKVEEITPDGVISRGLTQRRRFWSWKALKEGHFLIYYQPGGESAQAAPRGPVIRERGGRIEAAASVPQGDEERQIDYAIVNELVASIPGTWDRVQVDAEFVQSEVRATVRGTTADAIEPTSGLRNCLARLFEFTSDCQEIPCWRLAFTLERAEEGWRYEVRFDYP